MNGRWRMKNTVARRLLQSGGKRETEVMCVAPRIKFDEQQSLSILRE